jgi:hypothetical protein
VFDRIYLKNTNGNQIDYGTHDFPPDNISAVALGRLSSGHYVMAAMEGSTHTRRHIWLYTSKERKLLKNQTKWIFNQYLEFDSHEGAENINFLITRTGYTLLAVLGNTHCNSFSLDDPECLEVENGNAGDGNYIEIAQLVLGSDGKLGFNYMGNEFDFEDDDHCYFRAGGGIYVDPSGMPVVYCTGRSVMLFDQGEHNWNVGEHSVPES